MLNENIKLMRQSRGLSQEELARELKVVRQTVSKWERGLSVPDSEMLISISAILETNVSVLLGETVRVSKIEMNEDLLAISKKLEDINLQLVQIKVSRRKKIRWLLISLVIIILIIFIVLFLLKSPYLGWDYSHPETVVVGVLFHIFEWLFIRLSPLIFIGAIMGIFLKKKNA
ncbi:helix-turn-helix transcriptional regulator [Turicibacter sp. KK003]|uniref:helix-turn-helix domain-containing protein n=1 Tax=Turicibacter sp. KK003 TaxID=3114695 RepID=UPI0030D30FD8